MMKKTLLLSLFLALGLSVSAVPAKKGTKKVIKLENGTSVLAELKGDEFASYWQTEDGKTYSVNPETRLFQHIDLQKFIAQTEPKRLLANKARMQRANRVRGTRATVGGEHIEYKGKKKGLIILTEFADKKFQSKHGVEYYKNLANKEGFSTVYGHVGSVRDYFLAQSNGQFELDFDVVGPVQLPKEYAYYGAHSKDGDNDVKPGAMVAKACTLAHDNLGVNFADYDWNGDNEVDQVYVLYAGQGEAAGGDENTIWPHEWNLESSDWKAALSFDGYKVNTYACGPELTISVIINNFTGTYKIKEYPDGIGTLCHEFSHCLGFADMYDVRYGQFYGMGHWDLMDAGSYNGRSCQPSNYTAFERIYAGWIEPIVLDKPTSVRGMRSSAQYAQPFIIYNDANPDEYYLLENRQQEGIWDVALPGSGLMITHVDFKATLWESNAVNTKVDISSVYGEAYKDYDNDHERCTIFHADNKAIVSEDDEATDLYPSNGNTALTDTSEPAALIYTTATGERGLMGKPITNIVQNADGTIDFDFMGGSSDNIISGIQDVMMPSVTSVSKKVYTLDGRYVGDDVNSLGHGIYVINGKKIVK